MDNTIHEETEKVVANRASSELDGALKLMRNLFSHISDFRDDSVKEGYHRYLDSAYSQLLAAEFKLGDMVIGLCKRISYNLQQISGQGKLEISPELGILLAAIATAVEQLDPAEEEFEMVPATPGAISTFDRMDPQPYFEVDQDSFAFNTGKGITDDEEVFHQAPTRGCSKIVFMRGEWYWDLGQRTEEDLKEEAEMLARGQVLPMEDDNAKNK